MKLQCGVLHFDDRPITTPDSACLVGGLRNKSEASDESREIGGTFSKESLLMVYRGSRITKEESTEVQPFRLGPYVLTWDGRLDNREDLGRRLGIWNVHNIPDPALVLQAYTAFGDCIFETLVGEFALVLWCSRTQTLRFARSACGARTLYYALEQATLTWSSNFAHLVRVTNVDLTVNDDYAIEYLVSQPPASASPLKNIGVVPPNRNLQFTRGKFLAGRELWDPTRFATVRHRSDAEYEEHLREILEEAVTVRLRSDRPIFAELSGGLDSSTIVLMADRVLRKQNRATADLQTTSCVYERSETCDEKRFIRTIEEKRGISTHQVCEQDQGTKLSLSTPQFTGLPNPLHCFPGRYRLVAEQMKLYGAQVLLTGCGGDHLFWSEPDGVPLVADEITNAHFLEAHSLCRTWSAAATVPYYELLFKRAVPLAFERRLTGNFTYKAPALPSWIDSKFREKILFIRPNFERCVSWPSAPSKRAQIVLLEHMFRYSSSGFVQEYPDLYVTHPYSHRPLIEFCLGIPISQFLRNGETRSLMRRAFRDLLPAKTVKRVSKGLLDEAISRALRVEIGSFSDIANWKICELEYVVRERIAEVLRRAQAGELNLIGNVIRICSLERWLRSLGTARRTKTAAWTRTVC